MNFLIVNVKCEMMKMCMVVRVYLRIILHRVSMTLLLFTATHDWETVKMLSQETVHRNRPIKLVATEKAFNSQKCLITRYIVGCVIIYYVRYVDIRYPYCFYFKS